MKSYLLDVAAGTLAATLLIMAGFALCELIVMAANAAPPAVWFLIGAALLMAFCTAACFAFVCSMRERDDA